MPTPDSSQVSLCQSAGFQQATIVAHEPIAEATWRLRVDCPAIATAARPGQFAMLRIPNRQDPLLARPLAVYDVFADLADPTSWRPPAAAGSQPAPTDRRYADFVYAVAGKFTTSATALRPGDTISLWGPLGNGFQRPVTDHLVLVAGGIGQTALLMLGRDLLAHSPTSRVSFCWGARHGGLFGHVEDFRAAGLDVHLATLDGSLGTQGTVIDLLDRLEADGNQARGEEETTTIACCGPEKMMAAVSRWATTRGLTCQVSLETPMACGIGICFSCVAPVIDKQGSWDYRRTCIEGPVFDGTAIDWEAMA
jgi:dihydroorotate dehydrogenase electron transfer subunit